MDYYLTPIITFLMLSIAFMAMRLHGRSGPSKERLDRAARATPSTPAKVDSAPSIVRRRSSLLHLYRWNDGAARLVAAALWLEQLIASAGFSISVMQLIALMVGTAIFPAIALLVVLDMSILVAMPVGLLASIGMTLFFLSRRRARQMQRFKAVFPEALDLIVRGVRAGLPVSEAVRLIASDVVDPVGSAFKEVAANLAIGLSLDEALAILRKRVPLAEVKFFTISLTIQQETGGNLAEILSNLASIMRKRVQVEKKVSAMSSEARASALIIGSLPFIVGFIIYLFNSEYIEILFVDETGRMLLGAALGSMTFGAVVMRKLIRFDV